ncbi:TatD family deoxyribonuclease [Buchnera aphidicola (Thelaxes californica)]|uniref:TatD family deoxyribonuclease n=1 Tax=Buchnera aphidicola (Thelaxes californica) TaxID=1315998 RepID=A0A4D6YBQ9_9GAMM|nr:TatD family hydrolase [Buchnera aphidicola]QCI26809.1 TatD family deoxyribonuclease [Buchnera aphidicola (Thelaxes californica)]
MLLVDSHCHLHHLKKKNINSKEINEIINLAKKKKIQYLLNVAVSIDDFQKMLTMIVPTKEIFYSCGIHPLYVQQNCFINKVVEKFSLYKKVIAIGETGLDFYHPIHNQLLQKKIFKKHIDLAIKINKPIIVHTRNAMSDTIKILQNNNAEKCSGIVHSFTDNISSAKKILDLGFYISFSGIVTFKNANDVKKIAKFVPLNRILIETDSPYLAPVPYRGKENQPAYLYETAKYIAMLKNISLIELSENILFNFKKLFKL